MKTPLASLLAAWSLFALQAHAQNNQSSLTAIFDGEVAFAFQTLALPGGQPAGWPGAVLMSDPAAGRIAHRVVVDRAGSSYLIYKIQVEAPTGDGQFRLSILPPDADAVARYQNQTGGGRRQHLSLPYYPPPQEIRIGDVVMLDILEDRARNLTIVDSLAVIDPGRPPELRSPTAPARDFTLADVELSVMGSRLVVDGRDVDAGGGVSGAVIWFYIPEYGRFLFSVADQPGYGFQPDGVIHDNRLAFQYAGTRFEWISNRPILRTGIWRVWVRAEPGFRPPPFREADADSVMLGAADHVSYLLEPVGIRSKR